METPTTWTCFVLMLALSTKCTFSQQVPGADVGAPGFQGPRGWPGPSGPSGPRGYVGPAGNQGYPGPSGRTGATGAQGMPAPNSGMAGRTGATGATGSAGNSGPAGPRGDIGPSGPAGPVGSPGANVQIASVSMPQSYTDSDYVLLYFSLTLHGVMFATIFLVLIWQQCRISNAAQAIDSRPRDRPPSYKERVFTVDNKETDNQYVEVK